MPEINANFIAKAYELTAIAYSDNIECPPLQALNEWVMRQRAGTTPATGNFDDAVLAAVQSSPDGVGIEDLRSILATYKKPANQIGAALARLVKKELLAVAGSEAAQIWTFKTAPAAAGTTQPRTRTASGNGAGRTRGRPRNQPAAGQAAAAE